MARSAHAFVRGSTVQFYEWLHERGEHLVPKGPPVWICGDCHAGNLGPLANSKGEVEVQIRDLDQTVIGNPNHDLIRLALSLASAARGSDLPGVTTARMLEHMMEGYEDALKRGERAEHGQRPECVRVVMRRALRRTWKHLARERLRDLKPNIPLGTRYWPLSKIERKALRALFEAEEVRKLVTCLKGRDDDAKIELVDAAYWMKGCSSLGKLRYAVLLSVDEGSKDEDLCLIDIKEAIHPAAPRAQDVEMPKDDAKRIVEGARNLSPSLGERMMATRLLGRSVFLRELMPQDLKVTIDQLSSAEAVSAARFLATVVGKAHARQMASATRKEFYKDLRGRHTSKLDAPFWLWSSIVELAASHEAAYLNHCRRFALEQPGA
jgi:uncharacterized protein (DUF2252 family)